jgi:AcrR family transcriptional regulator
MKTSPRRGPQSKVIVEFVRSPLMGRREIKKQEKLARIKAAAFELFNEKGYEHATVREIAARAGVGFGTLFSYATEKRELLFLLFEDVSKDISDRAFRSAGKAETLVEQLVAVFAPLYRLHARNPQLGRALIGELTFTTGASMRGRFAAFDRAAFIGRVAEIVDRARAAGQIRTEADANFVARVVFSIFAWSLREWLAGMHPVVSTGVADLRNELTLLINGLGPVSGSRGKTGRAGR